MLSVMVILAAGKHDHHLPQKLPWHVLIIIMQSLKINKMVQIIC